MDRHRAVVAAVATVVLMGGCEGSSTPSSDPRSGAEQPSVTATATPASSAPATPTPATPATPGPVTIAFAGDVHFEGVLRHRLDDPGSALSPATRTLAAADVAVVNLETSVGAGGRPEPGKRFTFQAPATALTALAAAGVDVATMANNHAVDFGRAALSGTFAAVDAAARDSPPLAVVGIGRNARAAFRAASSSVDGTVVATIGATIADTDPTADPTGRWAATATAPGTADAVDPRRLLRAVARAEASADVVVVYMHWGIQGEACPTAGQRSLARMLVQRGADVVVGSHAHRLQGDGHLGDGYVAYGLGNYAWYQPSSGAGADTGVLTLTVRPAATPDGRATVTDADWEPARVGTDGLPVPVTGRAAGDFRADRAALRSCAGLAAASPQGP